MKRRFLTALAVAGLSLAGTALQAQTSTWTIDTAHSAVNFQTKHLAVSTVRGSITGVKGTIVLDEKDVTKSTVTATMEASSVTTSNDRRDTHLKSPDFFDVAKNPQLSFKSTGIKRVGAKLQLIGDLTLAGVTKSITLDLDGPAPPQKGQGGKIISGFSATGTLNRKDFDFGQKTPASAAIGDDIKFTIDVEIDKVS